MMMVYLLLVMYLGFNNSVTGKSLFYMINTKRQSASEGLLIYNNSGTACSRNFDKFSAYTICRDMGYKDFNYWGKTYGKSWNKLKRSFPMMISDIMCNSTYDYNTDYSKCSKKINSCIDENISCVKKFWQGCTHLEDVFLSCTPSTCEPGFLQPFTGSPDCQPCPPHTFSPFENNINKCFPCPGMTKSTAGSANCTCPLGKYFEHYPINVNSSELAVRCLSCPENYFSLGDQNCTRCPDIAVSKEGSGFCSCPAGTIWRSQKCEICPENTFSDFNFTSCKPCPIASTSEPGSDACECSPGFRWSNNTCVPCPENDTQCVPCHGNMVSSLGTTSCFCPKGTFLQNSTLHIDCVKCDAGTYSGRLNSSSCNTCPPNSHSNQGASSCDCDAGYELSTGLCKPCQLGQFSSHGANLCTTCPKYQVVTRENTCHFCRDGEFWDNYTCSPCADNYYSNGTVCLKCPDGLTAHGGFCYRPKIDITQKPSVDKPDNLALNKPSKMSDQHGQHYSILSTHQIIVYSVIVGTFILILTMLSLMYMFLVRRNKILEKVIGRLKARDNDVIMTPITHVIANCSHVTQERARIPPQGIHTEDNIYVTLDDVFPQGRQMCSSKL